MFDKVSQADDDDQTMFDKVSQADDDPVHQYTYP